MSNGSTWVEKTRFVEKSLLGAASIILLLLSLLGSFTITLSPLYVFGAVFLIFLAGYCTHIWLSFQNNQGDELILPPVLLLVGMGWVFVARIRPELGFRHFISICVGLLALNLASIRRISNAIRHHIRYILVLTLGLVVLTLLFGIEYGGTRGWLNLGLFTVQPAEFARLVFILFAAEILCKCSHGQTSAKLRLILIVATWAVLSILFILQNDYGTLFVTTAVLIVMFYVYLDKLPVLIGGVVAALGLLGLAYLTVPHVTLRINNWIDPWENMYSHGFQLVQSLFALSNGGLGGLGIGAGQSASIPAAHTDMIFSVIHEELGFLGAIAVILMYFILTYRGFRIALLCVDRYEQLMAVGISTMLAFQVICMIGGSTGLLPLSGLIMPFLSFGGTGMVTNLVMVGFLLTLPVTSSKATKDKSVLYVLALFLAGLLVCVLYLTYIQVFKVPWLWDHPANVSMNGIHPIRILDRHGSIIVEAADSEDNDSITYNVPETLGQTIGYVREKFGATGIYGDFQRILLGLTQDSFLSKIGMDLGLKQGNDWVVVLNIDLGLQEEAERLLEGRRGAIVLMEPFSGEVLVVASSPGFDPGTLSVMWDDLISDSDAPFFNRATYGLYPPGSVFKLVSAAAALELGIGNKQHFICEETVSDIGYVSCSDAHGVVSLREALAVSCNRAFVDLAELVGKDALLDCANRFGFGESLGYIGGSATSTMGNLEDARGVQLEQIAIGQGEVLVTPLHMALITAAIANGGNLVRPQLIAQIQDVQGHAVYIYEPEVLHRAISRDTAAALRDMMVAVVSEGTGRAAESREFLIAGKTGTAEVENESPHSWFVGFAPAESPRYCVAIMVENAGYGGDVAAPMARALLESAFEN